MGVTNLRRVVFAEHLGLQPVAPRYRWVTPGECGSQLGHRSALGSTTVFPHSEGSGLAVFDWARFKDVPYFLRTRFFGKTSFGSSIFMTGARFEKAVFGTVAFYETQFEGGTGFSEAEFEGANFHGACFESGLDLNAAKFKEPKHVSSWDSMGWSSFPNSADFTAVRGSRGQAEFGAHFTSPVEFGPDFWERVPKARFRMAELDGNPYSGPPQTGSH
ncbi:pentapeptide repeat-containing protein [Ornithinimicrobium sp. Arc0846-15]|nr:pentapeptide repeat-containing protein [Ornithinimicrobium laminariae]